MSFAFRPIYEQTQKLLDRRSNANHGHIYLDSERAKIYTDYYKAHEAEPNDLKRAHCLLEWASNKTIRVEPDDIFVGNMGRTYRALMYFPEWGTDWVYAAVHDTDENFRRAWQMPHSFAQMTDEDRQNWKEASEYWQDRSIPARTTATVPEEMRYFCEGDGCDDMWMRGPGLSFMPQGHVSPNFQKVISVGFGAIKSECEQRMNQMMGHTFGADAAKFNFYRSTAIVCDAAMTLSKRYAAEARAMAEKPECAARRDDFLEMADSLDWIMEHPARNTWEALQAVELYEMILICDGIQHGLTLGRIDQYAGWFAKQELEAGTLTEDELQVMADAFILKLQDNIATMGVGGNDMLSQLATSPDVEHQYYSNGQHYSVGGVLADGSDATNPLTIAFLQCCGRLSLADPSASVRVHKDTPAEVWQTAIEASKINGGVPTIENDDVIIPALMSRGISLEDARTYCIIGCVEPTVGGMEVCACGGTGTESMFNLVGTMVTAINNGCNPFTGYDRGPKTGLLYQHENFESFKKAWVEHLRYFVAWQVTECNFYELMYAEYFPNVAVSATMDGCMESGKDVQCGGAKYNSTGMTGCGIGNIADCLMTIKMAFDGRLGASPEELYDALAANWEGYEELQRKIETEVPHYGNDIAEVDELAAWAMTEFADYMASCTGPRGHYAAGTFTMTVHLDYGAKTWATPDGRFTGGPLADAISPRQGFDKNGPTAYLTSAAKLPHVKLGNGDQLNIKFTPSAVGDDLGTQRLRELFQAYFDEGGMQVQFNVVGSETLYDAQDHPENYKNLIVRIAGFSAYFVEMPKPMQDDFISRTEEMEV